MATTLFAASRVHTLADPVADTEVTGILVEDGVIVATGPASELAAAADTVVDYGSAVITPGLVDGHSHPVMGVKLTAGADLTDALDLDQVRAALAAERTRLEPGAWLKAWALNPIVFGGAAPSAAAIGEVLDGVKAYLTMFDGHSAIASADALAAAGLDGPRTFASSAQVVVDASGTPTGWLLEDDAASLVGDVIPEPTEAEVAARLARILRRMAASGYTELHVMDFREPTQEVLTRLEADGELPLRLGLNPMLTADAPDPGRVIALQGLAGRRWRVEGVKLMVDGTIDGGSAWLEYPDTHGDGLTALWRDFDAFREVVTVLHRAGVNCAVHAIGDRGVREVLAVFADLRAQYGPLAHHRIEHIETLPDETVGAFVEAGVAASMQPLHITCFSRADRTDNWSQRLGDIRVDHGFRWQDLRATGAVLALGSDWPIAPYDPRWIMADARLRKRYDRPAADPMQPWQALSALQALEGFTSHAAAAAAQPRRGRIQPGFDADFTVFAADPLTLDPVELGTVGVVATVVAGVPVE